MTDLSSRDEKRSKQKRSVACVSCRRQKSRCVITQKTDPPVCDRCRQGNIECRFELRANDKQWTASVEERLKRLEDGFQELLEAVQTSSFGSPIAEGIWPAKERMIVNPRPAERDASKDVANGMLSGILGKQDRSEEGPVHQPPKKRQKVDQDIVAKGIIDMAEARECITFFNTKLARYLPILVFKYMPQFDITVRERSPVLFVSILTVASLYHPNYQQRHSMFRREFETNAESINERPQDLSQTIDTILALSMAGAWLGGELGFNMSLKASNIAGSVLPDAQQGIAADQPQRKEMISAIGLMTYIIEQRLRIIHARPIDPSQVVNGKRRDVFFAQFLASQMSHRKVHHEMDVAELKITANVELCAIILMLQLDLYNEIKMDVITHWNHQLDKWLAEWMGKLTVNLLPSSWKPVLLTFHFAKLFLNSLVLSNVKPGIDTWQEPPVDSDMDAATRARTIKLAENSAYDILDMLVRDKDTKRLISVAPVFYPTIFITACALLLKLVAVSKSINYEMDDFKAVNIVSDSYNILSSKIASPVLPCYPSVKNLGSGLIKVSESQPALAPVEPQAQQPHLQEPHQPQTQNQQNQQNQNMYSSTQQQQPQQQQQQSQAQAQAQVPPQQPMYEDQNLWSFTPFRQRPLDEPLPLDIDNPAMSGLQTIWQNGPVDFMMDAYSASLLDSLASPLQQNSQVPPPDQPPPLGQSHPPHGAAPSRPHGSM